MGIQLQLKTKARGCTDGFAALNTCSHLPVATRLVVPAIKVDDWDLGVLQLDSIGVALGDARVLIDPAEALLVPNKTILRFLDPVYNALISWHSHIAFRCKRLRRYVPMTLIWKIEEAAGNATSLKHVEHANSFSHRKAVVKIAVYDNLGSGEAKDLLRRRRIPVVVVITRLPESSVKLVEANVR